MAHLILFYLELVGARCARPYVVRCTQSCLSVLVRTYVHLALDMLAIFTLQMITFMILKIFNLHEHALHMLL